MQLFASTAIWQLISWVFTALTARVLTARDYGLLGYSDALFPYVLMLATMKLDLWLLQIKEQEREKRETAFLLLLGLGVLATAVSFFGVPVLAWFYGTDELVLPLRVTGVVFIFKAIRTYPESLLRREMDFKQISYCNVVTGIIRGALQYVLALCDFGYWSLVIGQVVGDLLGMIWLVAARGVPLRPTFVASHAVAAVRFGFSATVSVVFWIVLSTADNIVVGKLFGAEALGFYAMAFYLADLPLGKLNQILTPVISSYFANIGDNKVELARLFIKFNRLTLVLIAPVLSGLAFVAPPLVPLLFGEKWVPMVTPLQVLCVVGVLRALTGSASNLLYAVGQPNRVLLATGVPAFILPVLFYMLGSSLGLNGVFLTWFVAYPLLGPLLIFEVLGRYLGVSNRTLLLNVLPPVGIAGLSYLLAILFLYLVPVGSSELFELIIRSLIFGAVTSVTMMILCKKDLLELLSQLKFSR
jgi:O-antigen/teichoic acid export membrane protein